jgi:hypothetical protein
MNDHDGFEERIRAAKSGNGAALSINIEWFSDVEIDVKQHGFVKGLLLEGMCSMAYGETGSAKTFLVTDLGVHVALGWPWFGHEVTQGVVIYIAAEAGSSMRRRIVALRQHYGLDRQIKVPFGLISTPINLLDPNMDLQALIQAIKAAKAEFPDLPLVLIIIDTVSRALAGGNENAPDDMGIFLRNIDEIRQDGGSLPARPPCRQDAESRRPRAQPAAGRHGHRDRDRQGGWRPPGHRQGDQAAGRGDRRHLRLRIESRRARL